MSNFSRRGPDDEDEREYGERPRRRVDDALDRLQDDYSGARDRNAPGNPPQRDRLGDFSSRPPTGAPLRGANDAPGDFRRQSSPDANRTGAPGGAFSGRSFPARDDANARPGYNDRQNSGGRPAAANAQNDEGRRGGFLRRGDDNKPASNTDQKSGGRLPFRGGKDDKPPSNADQKSGGRFPFRGGKDDKPAQPTGRFGSDRGGTPPNRRASQAGKPGEEKKGGLGGLLRRGSKGADDKNKEGGRSPFLSGSTPPGGRAPGGTPYGRTPGGDEPGGRFGTSRDRAPLSGDRTPGSSSPYGRSPTEDELGGRFGTSRERAPLSGDRTPGSSSPYGRSPTEDESGGRFGASRDRSPLSGDRTPPGGSTPFGRSSSSTLGTRDDAPGGRSAFGGAAPRTGGLPARPEVAPNRPLGRPSAGADRGKGKKDEGEKGKGLLGGLRRSKAKGTELPARGAPTRGSTSAATAGRPLARAETPPVGRGRSGPADLGAERRRSATAYTPARPLPGKDRGAFTLHQGLDLDRKLDLIGVALFGFALVAFFAVIPSLTFGALPQAENGLSGSINHLLGQLFGWGKMAVPIGTFTVGIWLMRKRFADTGFEVDYTRVVGVLSLFACVLTWIQMFSLINDVAPSVDAFRPISYHLGVDLGEGGGWFGHTVYLFLLSQLLDLGTLSVLLVWLIISLMLTFDLSVVELTGFVMRFVAPLRMSSEERARKKMAREVLTAQIVEAMRPADEAAAQLALDQSRGRRGARVPARGGAADAPTPAQAARATVESSPVRAAGAALAGAAAGAAAGDASNPDAGTPRRLLGDGSEAPSRPSPVINRRGGAVLPDAAETEANGTDRLVSPFAAAGTESAPGGDRADDRLDRVPPPRRMPHMRSSAPAEASAGAPKQAAEIDPTSATDAESEGGRRFGFLRRGGKASEDAAPVANPGSRPAFARPVSGEVSDGSRPAIPVPPRTDAAAPEADESESAARSGRLGRFLGRGRDKDTIDVAELSGAALLDAAVAATEEVKPGRRFPFRRGGGDAEQASPESGEHGLPASARQTVTTEAVAPGRRFPFRRGGGESPAESEQTPSEPGENGAPASARQTLTTEAAALGRRFPFRRGGTDASADAEQIPSDADKPADAPSGAPDALGRDALTPLTPRRRFPLGVDEPNADSDSEPDKPVAPETKADDDQPPAFSRDALRRDPLTPLTPRRRFPLGVDESPDGDPEADKPVALEAKADDDQPPAFSRDALRRDPTVPRRRSPLGLDESESESAADKPVAPEAKAEDDQPPAFSRDALRRDPLTPRLRSPLDPETDSESRPARPDQPERRGPSALDALAGAAGAAGIVGAASLADRLTRQQARFEPDADASAPPPVRPAREPGAPPAGSQVPDAAPPKMAQPARPDILARAPYPLPRRPSEPAPKPSDSSASALGPDDTRPVEPLPPAASMSPTPTRVAPTPAPEPAPRSSAPGPVPPDTRRTSDAPTVPIESEPVRRAPVPPPDRPAARPVETPPAPASGTPTGAPPAPTPRAPSVVPATPPAAAERPPLTPRIGRPQARPEAPLAALPRREPVIATSVAGGANAPDERPQAPARRGKVTYQPPDFRQLLRRGDERRINDEVLLDKARVIEDTLESFGAPGKVVEVNPGPVITQFGIEPDYLFGRSGKKIRVKVGSIARLDADLALALAARSIRIEAPVPGKGIVGIEVPNDEVTLVGLHDIMEAPEYTRINSKLRLALGLAVDGTPVAADLTQMPHLLIAGTTGSGKSVCVNSIITCLLLENTPEDVQFIMVDPKRVELTGYNGVPHLVAPVVVDLERIVGVLQWVQREMDERYQKFAAIAARNILDYNNKIGPDVKKMPYYVVVIDELADLMMLAPDETERLLARLAQMARATGIHLIISTQRPSVDIITGLIKANFPARIAFAVASSVDSRVILDQPGAEKLLGRGDMLYQSPDAAAPLRMQGVFVSDEEINRITTYWRSQALQAGAVPGLVSSASDLRVEQDPLASGGVSRRRSSRPAQPMLWNEENMTDDDGGTDDEMYDEAVDLVQRLNKASISLLQRRLRIGYTRAARLIDLMETDGIIGPAQEGSKPREVLKPKIESRD